MMGYRGSRWDRRRAQVYRRDGYRCVICGARGGNKGNTELHVHHIVPRSGRGTDEIDNLVTLCYSCHNDQHEHNVSRNLEHKDPGGHLSHPAPNLHEIYLQTGSVDIVNAIDINKTRITHPKNIEVLRPQRENKTLYDQMMERKEKKNESVTKPESETRLKTSAQSESKTKSQHAPQSESKAKTQSELGWDAEFTRTAYVAGALFIIFLLIIILF